VSIASVIALALALLAPAVRAWGQMPAIPAVASDGGFDPVAILERGRELERDRRWAEALNHYEQAVRSNPSHRELTDRLSLAKAHFDVERRYTDARFVQTLENTRVRESLDAYGEVLTKIQSHFVQPPQWHDLVRHGTFHWEVALTEPLFLRRHVPGMTADQINACRREIRQITDTRVPRNRTEARDLVGWVARVAEERLGLPSAATLCEYVCGAMNCLDDYSGYLTPSQLEEVFSQIEGNFVGLGVELKADGQGLMIVSVIRNSPADKGGLRSGDRIVAVDGQSTAGKTTDVAADMLKGVAGSIVVVDVMDADSMLRSVRMIRERVDVPSVDEVRMVDPAAGIGYFKLTSFQKTTSRDVDAALWSLHERGLRHLIVDVRGNPGGLLTAAVEVADKFIEEGLIVMTRGRSANEDNDYQAQRKGTWRVPLSVLIDSDSASASEIFAGAIRDHRRGRIVGVRSYGKGSVQGIFPLTSSNAGVRLTTAKFFSPSGQEINKKGVMPDIVVRTVAKPLEGVAPVSTTDQPNDAILNAAVSAIRESR
jgi:carboxyl-terminal processing protease